jgi:hypothetical protein
VTAEDRLQPRLTDAELVTLAVMQTLLGYTSESRWVRYARTRPEHPFRYLPDQPGAARAGGTANGAPIQLPTAIPSSARPARPSAN